MRVLFDVAHPAHVHFYRHLRRQLVDEGHATLVVGRDKDVTLDLLRAFRIPHYRVGRSGARGMAGQALELLDRDYALLRLARRFRPDLVLTRSPAGAQVARLTGATGVFDTDDGRAVGVHFWASAPFAHVITSPDSLTEDYGPRHRRYRGYKALAYLHPNRFRPDPAIRAEVGVAPDTPLFVVRFVANVASHDRHTLGLPADARRRLVQRLARVGTVMVTSEGPLAPEFEPYRARVAPHRMHDLLAAADLVVGDSQSMAIEAGLLATPSIRLSSFTGRVSVLAELEERYGLVSSFRPDEVAAFEDAVARTLDDLEGAGARMARARERMLEEKEDVTAWYRRLLDELVDARTGVGRRRGRR